MLFNSLEFLVLFLPITLSIFYSIDKYLPKIYIISFLILASFVFYGYWNPSYCFLLQMSNSPQLDAAVNPRFAERLNGWAAMMGFWALVGAYVSTRQIIPGIV